MQGRRLSEDEKRELREMLERESTREVSHKQKTLQTSRLALAAFICSVLPFAPFLCLLLAIVPAIGIVIAFVIVIPSLMLFPFHAPLLGVLGISLAIVSVKREPRVGALAVAAIIIGLFAIGIGLNTLRLFIVGRWWGMILDKY